MDKSRTKRKSNPCNEIRSVRHSGRKEEFSGPRYPKKCAEAGETPALRNAKKLRHEMTPARARRYKMR